MFSKGRAARNPFILGGLLTIALLWIYNPLFPASSTTAPGLTAKSYVQTFLSVAETNRTLLRRRIALASNFPFHFDTWLPVAHTLSEILDSDESIRAYGRQPFAHGFQEISDSLQLSKSPIQPTSSLVSDVRSRDLFPSEPGAMIDTVILGTCEIDMHEWNNALLDAWDARPEGEKFKLVCMVHNFLDQGWHHYIPQWAARGALRLLPIGEHVARSYRRHFQVLADERDPSHFGAFFEHVDIDVHVPVLELPEYGSRRTQGQLSRAMIQGSFQKDRRDYDGVFEALVAALQHDSELWGYRSPPPSNSTEPRPYEPILDGKVEPFTLHLAGKGEIVIPVELENVVVLHRNLDYAAFYKLTQSMDVIVPAFPNHDYYETQASSTVVMAVQCGVPILTTARIREAYGYINDDRVVITRPQALREIEAIGILRSTSPSMSSNLISALSGYGLDDLPEDFASRVKVMRDQGFRRSQSGYADFKRELQKRNREAMFRVLSDLPGQFSKRH